MTEIEFTYTNWRGEKSVRKAIPLSMRYGTSEWHKEPQWLMAGLDTEKNAEREFAVRDMLLISPENVALSFGPPEREDVEQTCEHCSKNIKEGDLHFPCEDGPVLCADCAPTYGDALQNMQNNPNLDIEDLKAFLEGKDEHLNAGGSLDDKLPLTPL